MPGLLSSPVCLTVIWFLSCSLCSSQAQGWTDEVIREEYGHLDSNVTLTCGKPQIRLPVVWRLFNSLVLPWHNVTSDGRLVLLRANESAQGTYSCYDTQGNFLDSVSLMLGRPPGPLSISCQVPNHTHVRCSWVESVNTMLPAKYNASFSNGPDWKPCIVDVTGQHCDFDQLAFWRSIHIFRVTVTNVLGSKTKIVHFNPPKLLKPNPPESVEVKELKGFPTRLIVSWNFPSSWPLEEHFPLLFLIRYRPQHSQHWLEILTERSPAVIYDALAGHLHQVQVRARDEINSDSQWSEWSPLLLVKPWEVNRAARVPEESEDHFTDIFFSDNTEPETTTKSHNPVHEDEGNLGLVIVLVLFSVVILTTVLSLIFVVWMRQRRRDQAIKKELTSMVKMKSMPI